MDIECFYFWNEGRKRPKILINKEFYENEEYKKFYIPIHIDKLVNKNSSKKKW